jgi:uncharacterized protein (TIGR02757 family)
MNSAELKEFLNYKADEYENPNFIELDPISIPHRFSRKEDIEIAGLLSATIAWGNRKSILTNASKMMALMDHSPYEFVCAYRDADAIKLTNFVHRTFNAVDFDFFLRALQNIYLKKGGLEKAFEGDHAKDSIYGFRTAMLDSPHLKRSEKHLSNPYKNSAAKRLNMFLRWMVRPASKGVDFGIWTTIKSSQLSCPLDVHSGNIARKLGLLERKPNDWKAVDELDTALHKLDSLDPVKYDFALFGMGVNEKF